MTSIRKAIKAAKRVMNAKSITINFGDSSGKNIKLNKSQNKAKREALAKFCSEYDGKR
ncbi:hypothetical protein [Phocaeicola paurosaccharolyticus]|uniref:hypothetical protein n=1 Tax=Phocaeicola paurosaccharolyticus TaxID=732242 RepID=UPI002FE3CE3C